MSRGDLTPWQKGWTSGFGAGLAVDRELETPIPYVVPDDPTPTSSAPQRFATRVVTAATVVGVSVVLVLFGLLVVAGLWRLIVVVAP